MISLLLGTVTYIFGVFTNSGEMICWLGLARRVCLVSTIDATRVRSLLPIGSLPQPPQALVTFRISLVRPTCGWVSFSFWVLLMSACHSYSCLSLDRHLLEKLPSNRLQRRRRTLILCLNFYFTFWSFCPSMPVNPKTLACNETYATIVNNGSLNYCGHLKS